jgi:hypothetical protein
MASKTTSAFSTVFARTSESSREPLTYSTPSTGSLGGRRLYDVTV